MASKSLGTLTLDLVAKVGGFVQGMDKASRKSQKTAKQIERHSNQIGKALTAASAAAVTGMAALVASTANSAREVQNLSRLAGTTPQEFQKLTYAAKRFGLEQDKVSDILKDTNDRIGDFIQTGGGPMADFFENIAPKVGVTAEQFERLSGPQALQLYVKSLQEAGVSQKDMTFYMEAMASDSTALIPLLRDNGRLMGELGDEAERTGNVFSDIEFQQLESVRRGMDELTGAATGMKNEIAFAALPAINDLVDLLSDEETMKSAQSLGIAVVSAMNKAAKAVDGAIKVTQFLAEELAAMTEGAAPDDIVRLQDELGTLYEMLDNPTKRLRFFGKDGAVVYYNKDEIWDMIAETENKIVDFRNNVSKGAGTRPAPLLQLVDEPTVPSTSGGGGAPTGGLGGPSEVEKGMADRRAALIGAFQTERLAILEEYGRTQEEIKALEQVAIEEGGITQMQATDLRIRNEERKNAALAELRQADLENNESYWVDWLESAEANLQNFDALSKTVIDNFTTGFGNAFESIIFDSENLDDALKGIAETILRSVVNSIGQMAAQWLALQAVQAIMGTSATATTVAQAAIASAAWAPAAAMASLATMGGNAVPAAAALTSTTALSSTLAVVGMAHDGIDSVPEEGTWLLDKGERVLTSETSAKLDATLSRIGQGGSGTVVNVNNAPAGTRTEESTDSQGNRVIDIFIADMSTGGPMSRTMQSTYGLKRQGR